MRPPIPGAEPALPPVRGLVDGDGRLAAADPRLAELNARAGGAIGAPLAVPQLATLARLARRLRILIARSVTVADGEDDVELWVRAEPDGELTHLAITGWTFRTGWTPPAEQAARAARDFVLSEGEWGWETDAALRLTFVAEEAAVRAGAGLAGLLGQPVTKVFALTEAADGGFPILAAVAKAARFDGQLATVRGSNRAVVLSGAPRLDAEGRFAGFLGAARPVEEESDAPEVEDRLPPAFGSQLDKALRGPLGRIVANADSIHAQADGPLKDQYADYAADIATAGRHLMGLVDDLLDLQFVERDDFTVAREDVDLADVARRAAGLLTVRAEAQKVTIDRPANDATAPATGEFRRALQVLVNLIGNAVRYSPAGSTVWIRLQREGDRTAVIVADQGKGVALQDQARIFEKFARVDSSEPGGSGLGLYISQRLARAMGGDIVVDSAPGEGARFVFTLPAR